MYYRKSQIMNGDFLNDISYILLSVWFDPDTNPRRESTSALIIAPFTNDCVNGCETERIVLPAAQDVQNISCIKFVREERGEGQIDAA